MFRYRREAETVLEEKRNTLANITTNVMNAPHRSVRSIRTLKRGKRGNDGRRSRSMDVLDDDYSGGVIVYSNQGGTGYPTMGARSRSLPRKLDWDLMDYQVEDFRERSSSEVLRRREMLNRPTKSGSRRSLNIDYDFNIHQTGSLHRPRTPTTYRDPHEARLSEPLTRRRIHISTPVESHTLKGSLKKTGESVTRRNSNIYRSVELTERIGVEEWRHSTGIDYSDSRRTSATTNDQFASEVVVTSSHLNGGGIATTTIGGILRATGGVPQAGGSGGEQVEIEYSDSRHHDHEHARTGRSQERTISRSTDRGTPRNLDRSTPLWVTSGQHDRSTPRSSSQTVQSLHQPVVHYSQADQIEKTNIVSFQDTIPRPKLIETTVHTIKPAPVENYLDDKGEHDYNVPIPVYPSMTSGVMSKTDIITMYCRQR